MSDIDSFSAVTTYSNKDTLIYNSSLGIPSFENRRLKFSDLNYGDLISDAAPGYRDMIIGTGTAYESRRVHFNDLFKG